MNDFDHYQDETGKTAIYPAGTQIEALSYLAMGLASEAGEVAGKVKKILRDGTRDTIAIEDEVGDVLWYCARIVDELGGDLSEVAARNLSKLADRKKRGVIGGSGDKR